MTTDLADIKKQINEKTAAGTKLAEEISQLQATTETRREEVIRLQAKLDEVRADKFRADEQKKHQDFVDRMIDKGYTEKQVRLLCEWYLRVRKSS